MPDRTFGQALGALILQKRKAAGLTQMQLAEDAFETTAKTRRISELENGTVDNPHPKTIDPIIVALKISASELAECAKSAVSTPDNELDRAYREARNLIDAIAKQFEHSKPDATLAELDEFLRAKAKEWATLRARIESIDIPEAEFSDLKTRAAEALSQGDFQKVDELLSRAEETYQKARTLNEVRRYAEIRITRGDASLLQGNSSQALEFYLSAAEFFRPFDESEMALALHRIAGDIYESSRRSIEPPFFVAAKLLETLISLPLLQNNSEEMATASYRLGLVYRNDYERKVSEDALESLDKAIHYSRQALTFLGEGDSFRIISTKISLANCLSQRGKERSTKADIREAIDLLEEAKTTLKADRGSAELAPYITNSLGVALLNLYAANKANETAEILASALTAFSAAAEASEALADFETWGAAKANIAGILARQARTDGISDHVRHFLRIRAISEYGAAIETFPSVSFPKQFADAQYGLAEVLLDNALDVSELKEFYLARSLHAFQVASAIFTEEMNPAQWAKIQMNMAYIFSFHAKLPGTESSQGDYQHAIDCYHRAMNAWNTAGQTNLAEKCKLAIEIAQAELAASRS